MKKLLTIVFAASLLIACNNNGGMGIEGGWSKAERDGFVQNCVQGGQSKEICSCVLQKFEKKYPNYKEADAKGTEQDGMQWAQECLNGIGNDMQNDFNNNGNNNNKKEEDYFGNNNNGANNNMNSGWTNQQRQQYIQQCAGAATQQQGVTQEQANSYCECMTGKVEQKYSFRQANQLTAAEFQSEEWQNAAANCRAGY